MNPDANLLMFLFFFFTPSGLARPDAGPVAVEKS
jgi:hypothetical protein